MFPFESGNNGDGSELGLLLMDRMAGLFVGILPDTLSLLILSDRFRPCSTSHKEVRESIDPPVLVGDLPFHSFSKFKHTHTHRHNTGVTAAIWQSNEWLFSYIS